MAEQPETTARLAHARHAGHHEVLAPRSQFYQGSFGRLFRNLTPWTPPGSTESEQITSMFTYRAPASTATRSHSRRVSSMALQESAATLTPERRMSLATRYATRYPSPWTSKEHRSLKACSMVSIRKWAAPNRDANPCDSVVLPLPGSPENM